MGRIDSVIRQGFVANANAEGRLKGWDDEVLEFKQNETCIKAESPNQRPRSTTLVGQTKFGAIENIRNFEETGSEINVEPMADIIRRRRSTSLSYIRDLLGI
jgi:hypothetical protein